MRNDGHPFLADSGTVPQSPSQVARLMMRQGGRVIVAGAESARPWYRRTQSRASSPGRCYSSVSLLRARDTETELAFDRASPDSTAPEVHR